MKSQKVKRCTPQQTSKRGKPTLANQVAICALFGLPVPFDFVDVATADKRLLQALKKVYARAWSELRAWDYLTQRACTVVSNGIVRTKSDLAKLTDAIEQDMRWIEVLGIAPSTDEVASGEDSNG